MEVIGPAKLVWRVPQGSQIWVAHVVADFTCSAAVGNRFPALQVWDAGMPMGGYSLSSSVSQDSMTASQQRSCIWERRGLTQLSVVWGILETLQLPEVCVRRDDMVTCELGVADAGDLAQATVCYRIWD